MKISILSAQSNQIKETLELSWDEINESFFSKHETQYLEKIRVPMFSPAEFKGVVRNNQNVVAIHFGAIDLDDCSQEDLNYIGEKLKDTEYTLYTSWSHSKELQDKNQYRARVIFPFSRPVLTAEWDRFWPKLNLFFNKLLDAKCKDLQRGYFLPACLNPEDHFIVKNSGTEFDVNKLLMGKEEQISSMPVTKEEVEDLANKLLRKTAGLRIIGKAIQDGLQGLPVAEIGDRDDTLFKIANQLAETFPKASPNTLASFFKESLKAMTNPNSSKDQAWVEGFPNKIKKAIERVAKEAQTQEEHLANSQELKIKQAFGSDQDRTHPYTEEELQTFATDAKTTPDLFKRRWILQWGRLYYIFQAGKYLAPITREALVTACDIHLAPAITAGVSVWRTGPKGQLMPKTEKELMNEYGTPVFKVEMDLTINKDFFNDNNQTLIEAPCPKRDLKAQFNAHVSTWLEKLSGDEHEKLLDWLSQVPNLNEPCAALYIGETAGVGKSLLAMGISRIWTTSGPTSLSSVMGNFNEAILQCPFIFADESMPADLTRTGDTGSLREFIQATSRTVNRKNIPRVSLKGAIRLMLASNSQNMLESKEELTHHAINGIMERFIYIPGNPQAAEFLENLGGREVVNKFITEDLIAKHVLWLSENRIIENKTRFLVSGKDSTFHRTLAIGTGLASAVMHWMVSYLHKPNLIDNLQTGLVKIKDGELLVTSKGLSDYWHIYETHVKAPTPAQLSRSLVRICSKERRCLKSNGRAIWYWPVDLANLVAWSEMNGYGEENDIKQLLSQDTESAIEYGKPDKKLIDKLFNKGDA